MRRPTAKELGVMEKCVDGLREDVKALSENPTRDVIGTFYVNVGVLVALVKKLEEPRFHPSGVG